MNLNKKTVKKRKNIKYKTKTKNKKPAKRNAKKEKNGTKPPQTIKIEVEASPNKSKWISLLEWSPAGNPNILIAVRYI